jgi:DNA mismatch repair ATPase MutS
MLRLPVMRQRYFLNRLIEYKKNVLYLLEDLEKAPLKSEGLIQFREDLKEYASSEEFKKLSGETEELKRKMQEIIFRISVKDNHITIKKLPPDSLDEWGKTDFEEEINKFFGQFAESRTSFPNLISEDLELNPVEEQILEALMRLYPEPFSHLEKYYKKQWAFVPQELISYHQELGFYIVWLEYIIPKQDAGLSFCFPMIIKSSEDFMAANCFDLMLADQMSKDDQQLIRNNLILHPGEHILVLTGPNQGGKTTYARMVGQLFYLASLGIPVPGTVVKIFLPDHIFTHFERQESQETLNGKLKDDIVRIHDILEKATSNSLILINEMFSSTTLRDAEWLAKKILDKIDQIGCLCLYVTFINALSDYIPGTVSLISQIGKDGEERTYQIIRSDSDGRAYAKSMVDRYALTYKSITERIGSRQ